MGSLADIIKMFVEKKINIVQAVNNAYDLGKNEIGVDVLVKELSETTKHFLFIEDGFYKILNEFSVSGQQKLRICPMEEGIKKALTCAVVVLKTKKNERF